MLILQRFKAGQWAETSRFWKVITTIIILGPLCVTLALNALAYLFLPELKALADWTTLYTVMDCMEWLAWMWILGTWMKFSLICGRAWHGLSAFISIARFKVIMGWIVPGLMYLLLPGAAAEQVPRDMFLVSFCAPYFPNLAAPLWASIYLRERAQISMMCYRIMTTLQFIDATIFVASLTPLKRVWPTFMSRYRLVMDKTMMVAYAVPPVSETEKEKESDPVELLDVKVEQNVV